jgi:hypothetical protein
VRKASFGGQLLANGPAALHGNATEPGSAVSAGNAKAAIAAAPPETRGFLGDAAQQAFVSGLNEIFVIAGVAALIGAALSLLLIRTRDLHAAQNQGHGRARIGRRRPRRRTGPRGLNRSQGTNSKGEP